MFRTAKTNTTKFLDMHGIKIAKFFTVAPVLLAEQTTLATCLFQSNPPSTFFSLFLYKN